MAWFKRKETAATGPFDGDTFKTRVEGFWEEFEREADRMQAVIDDGRCGDLLEETRLRMERTFPGGMGWVFGPARDKEGHAFILSPEGARERQFLAEYWLSRAPDLPHWEFHPAKQPDPGSMDHTIRVGEDAFRFAELWVSTRVDREREKLDLTAWHPHFGKMEDRADLFVG